VFVVFAIMRLYRASGADPRFGFVWYLPAFALCWVLGVLVARGLSLPCERWLRGLWLRPAPAATGAAHPAH
jgi:hypothetical protein